MFAQPAALAGRWAGAVLQQGTPLLIELEFEVPPAGGALTTTLTLPYSAYQQFPYEFAYDASGGGDGVLRSGLFGDMTLVVDFVEDQLRGDVAREDSVVATVFLQRVIDHDLPEIEVEEVEMPAGAVTLAGSLVSPPGPGPHPAAVLVNGRGAEGARVDMLSFWGTVLARHGIAALALDRRGTGRSTGDAATATARDRFEDLHAALSFLHARPDVRSDAVGVIGLGEGGWIGPMVAVERDDVAFVVAMASSAETLADQQGHVNTALMAASGRTFSDQQYQDAFLYQKRTVELAAAGASWEEFEAVIAAARTAPWAEFAVVPDSLTDPELVYFRAHADYDPEAALRALDLPFLVVLAEDDDITATRYSVPLYEAYQSGNDAFSLVVLPRTKHNLGRDSGMVGQGEWPHRFYRHWTRPPLLYSTVLGWVRGITEADDIRDTP